MCVYFHRQRKKNGASSERVMTASNATGYQKWINKQPIAVRQTNGNGIEFLVFAFFFFFQEKKYFFSNNFHSPIRRNIQSISVS